MKFLQLFGNVCVAGIAVIGAGFVLSLVVSLLIIAIQFARMAFLSQELVFLFLSFVALFGFFALGAMISFTAREYLEGKL